MKPDPEIGHKHNDMSLCLPLPRLAEVSFAREDGGVLSVLTDEDLSIATGARIAFTGRCGGVSEGDFASLNLSLAVGDSEKQVLANRAILLDALEAGAFASRLIVPNQVHGSRTLVVDDVESTKELAAQGADGIVCCRKDVPVLLCFADCTPVICVAPDGSFAVAHAGWRGALAGIPGIALGMLAQEAGCKPSECNSYIGPHIGACCYEVGADLLQKFVAEFGDCVAAPEDHLDLSAAVTASLLAAGAQEGRIADALACTACNVDSYYSYRAEDGVCGRHGALAFREENKWD